MHARRHPVTHVASKTDGSNTVEMKGSSCKQERQKAWEELLSKGLSQWKLEARLDTGYIATIFSANYSPVLRRNRLHIKTFDKDDLLLGPLLPCTEDFAQKKTSELVKGRLRFRRRSLSMVSDTRLVHQPLSNSNEKELTGQRTVEGVEAAEDLETSKSWELTKDLDKHGDYSKVEPQELAKALDEHGVFSEVKSSVSLSNEEFCCLNAAIPMVPLNQSGQATAPHTVSFLTRARTLPRAKYLSSSEITDNVDCSIVLNKNSASCPEQSVCLAGHDAKEAEELVEPNLMHQDDGALEIEGVNTCTKVWNTSSNIESFPLCEKTINVESHRQEQTTSAKAQNLQKALSFKYILHDCSIESEKSETVSSNHASPQLSMLHPRSHNEDNDDDGASISCNGKCMSSPEFSSPASLKDWLSTEDSPFEPAARALQAGNETSTFDTFGASPFLSGLDFLSPRKACF